MIHVGGTNGKGSTCAFLRAIGEAAGMRVHVYTSPHLVRFNERIRIAGSLVSDDALAAALEDVERVNAGAPITVFEVITAVALHLFAGAPAELCVLEVGLGGRGDATNVVPRPAACAITAISLDHRELLGDTLAAIAFEKAGIMKPGVPVRHRRAAAEAAEVLLAHAEAVGAPCWLRGRDWDVDAASAAGSASRMRGGALDLPPPSLPGCTSSTTRASPSRRCARRASPCPEQAIAGGLAAAEWPARLQRLRAGWRRVLPAGWELWLDGGHNPGAGIALARHHRWLERPAGAPRRRHEAGQGRRRVPAPPAAARGDASGRSPSRASTWRCRWRRSSPPPAGSPARARP